MPINVQWSEITTLVKLMRETSYASSFKGKVYIETDDQLELLKKCFEFTEDTNLCIPDVITSNDINIGGTYDIEISPRPIIGLVVKNLEYLLKNPQHLIKEPPHFIFTDELILNSDPVEDFHQLNKYRIVLSFISYIESVCDFFDKNKRNLIFVKNKKIEVPIIYNIEDIDLLKEINIQNIQSILKIVPQNIHESHCSTILAESIVNMIESMPAENRFRHLLHHAIDLKSKYVQNYNIFVSGFSYEKVRDEIESARVEYASKIHKVFSEIQNQLLSIPVATIIVATQMKDSKAIGYEYWVNVSVLIGCWVFVLLMTFLLYNQAQTLDVIQNEVDRQKDKIKKEYPQAFNLVSETFEYLNKRIISQKCMLLFVFFIVLAGLIFSHFIFYKLSPNSSNYIGDLIRFCLIKSSNLWH